MLRALCHSPTLEWDTLLGVGLLLWDGRAVLWGTQVSAEEEEGP